MILVVCRSVSLSFGELRKNGRVNFNAVLGGESCEVKDVQSG